MVKHFNTGKSAFFSENEFVWRVLPSFDCECSPSLSATFGYSRV